MRVSYLVFWLCFVSLPAAAGDVWTEPFSGIRHLHRTGPANLNLHAAVVDLCTPGVSVKHTAFHERQQRTSTFAMSVGAQLAVNGDFSCRPIDVIPNSDFPPCRGRPVYGTYGIAAHAGEPWPDTIYLDALLGFGHGRVQMYDNDEDQVFNPDWMSEVISGHGSIVRDGQLTIDDCPINPRTAIGLSQDHTQVMVAVVDGRNGWRGMTCLELGAVLIELGADRAFALDGGGSSTFWMEGQGVLNHPSDGSERVVGPHLAFFASGSGASPYCEAPFSVSTSVSLPGVQPVGGPVGLVPVSPQRLFDTRHPALSNGLIGLTRTAEDKVAAQTSFAFAGFSEAKAVVLNLTAANPSTPGFVSAWPTHLAQPDVSTLNFISNQSVANLLGLPLGTERSLSFYTHADTHLLGDLQGYFRDSGSGFFPVSPHRTMDTRSGSRIQAGTHTQIYPPHDGVTAVAMQVTTVSPTTGGFITVFPCDQPVPDASHLNHSEGENRAASVIAKMGTGGICAYSYAETDMLVDVHGVFREAGGSFFQAVRPTRVMDTRQSSLRWHGRLNANQPVRIPFRQIPGMPSDADAVWLNLTAVSPVDNGFLSLVPCDVPVQTSVLNFEEERNTPANVLMGLDADGALCLNSSVRTHILIDVFGYFVPTYLAPRPDVDAGISGSVGEHLDAGSADVAMMSPEDNGGLAVDAGVSSAVDAAMADVVVKVDAGSPPSSTELDAGTMDVPEGPALPDAAAGGQPTTDQLSNRFACTQTNANAPLWLFGTFALLLWFIPRQRRRYDVR